MSWISTRTNSWFCLCTSCLDPNGIPLSKHERIRNGSSRIYRSYKG